MEDNLLSYQITDRRVDLYERIISDLQDQQFSVVDAFFDDELLERFRKELLVMYEKDQFKKAAVGNKTSEVIRRQIRGDFIKWIDRRQATATQLDFLKGIDHFVNYFNRTCFLGILEKEFHYAVYPKGTFYKRHLDAFQQHHQHRKLSMVLYLNEYWAAGNGGELVIYQTQNNREIAYPILPVYGRLVIFESQELIHEVKPVNDGLRLSITGWLKTR